METWPFFYGESQVLWEDLSRGLLPKARLGLLSKFRLTWSLWSGFSLPAMGEESKPGMTVSGVVNTAPA